mmetsp:Transcript_3654/g.8403  ORF Transcript_3654/g.8403 Transcript_3654/m.8403 type:complete len:210 (-) Transcript_3654:2078-2707(-)|eukprot:CAMPEP_0113611340 /NCGR_PEP_ID=MMETSP0017_2-20120614/5504_1 /TAXON_ID=2856 /ORGANISM="Cylindrotheca closterium" /LENGTH=209 /DNA_ID=CAMNT_0000520281 /DNA_START=1046 /DNA_END=1675 /DNA_ORIENTATION=+ /assembly_acc=CAM_ASM_000147
MTIDIGVLTLMAGPLVAIVCCAAGLRTYFRCMNRRLRAESEEEANKSEAGQQHRRRRHRTKRNQTGPIDLDKMDTNEKSQDIIRQTRVERMMDHFQFGVCVEVDDHLIMVNSEDGAKDIEAAFAEPESSSQEQLPADEDFSTNNSTHDDCCAICLEPYAVGDDLCTGKTEQCSHVFHKHCMVEWIRRHNRCPICRSNLMQQAEMRIEVV